MAEPASSTVGVAIAAGTITLTGSILGVQYDALLAGLAGGLVSLSYLPPMSPVRIAGSVAGSSLIGGWFAPLASITAANYFPFISGAGETAVRIAAAATLGLCAQVLIPAAFAWLRAKGGAAKGGAS
ncbi:hypothetical protein ASC94_10160 [Massilia sp. Root418]|uniref:hypothetical protein n=1 Tax=Massilia sp. Root418 TaxID=1736532 RepID=UPI000700AC82|nr:hypothetical protein [Massilia sp. Root418]KQW97145.1 hypothetical protein ASC94_10160 [Massilia sp. Root418]